MTAYSVAEITSYIRDLLALDSVLQDVWVTGEVSNMRRAASGHWYFTLKDAESQLRCVMFKFEAARQTTIPSDGDQISVHGQIGVYEARGEYQLYADLIRPVGVGTLYLQFEALKNRLQAEGLFDEERKRPLPAFPHCIGIVTSADAAAFRDVQNVLRRRFPLARVLLSPTLVQGQEAPPRIIRAISSLSVRDDVDLILLVRGGGSLEDLWAFNDEGVARAIAESRIPIISGVGHETDFTIADFVADLRAPTPSAAAELATPNIEDLYDALRQLETRHTLWMRELVAGLRAELSSLSRALLRASPAAVVRNARLRLDELNTRLLLHQQGRLNLLKERQRAVSAALEAANPQAILARGYAIVRRSEDGAPVRGARDARPGTGITIQLQDDELKARVEDPESHERYKRTLF